VLICVGGFIEYRMGERRSNGVGGFIEYRMGERRC